MRALLVLVVLSGCATPRGPWRVVGADWDVQAYADATLRVTPDVKGWVARGGLVEVAPDLTGRCPVTYPSGCASPGHLLVLWRPDVRASALAHEMCHLGLARGGGYAGPVIEATEPQADACSLLVNKEVPWP